MFGLIKKCFFTGITFFGIRCKFIKMCFNKQPRMKSKTKVNRYLQ